MAEDRGALLNWRYEESIFMGQELNWMDHDGLLVGPEVDLTGLDVDMVDTGHLDRIIV
jgi:hypothetical protein